MLRRTLHLSTLGSALRAHHEDDASWHVLQGTLRFTFADRTVEAKAGSTFVVPAGVPHTYDSVDGARYVLVLKPRLRGLITGFEAKRLFLEEQIPSPASIRGRAD